MTGVPPYPLLSNRAELERRFDGPIPFYLLETHASRRRRCTGAHSLIAAMAVSHHRELWRQLAQTRVAFESAAMPLAAFYRGRLDAAARNLASLLTNEEEGKQID